MSAGRLPASALAPPPILTVLIAFGSEDTTKPATVDAARAARVLLETRPPAMILPLIAPLWERENKAYARRQNSSQLFFGLALLTICVSFLCVPLDNFPVWLQRCFLAFSAMAACVFCYYGSNNRPTPLHTGLARVLQSRSQSRFVPQMIEALSVTAHVVCPVSKAEIRSLLTRYLPVWCEEDKIDLTEAQQEFLLTEIREVNGGGNFMMRPLGKADSEMTVADADFALAAISALCYARAGVSKDAITRRILSELPAPVTDSDPRRDIHRAAEALLTVQGR